MDRRIYATNISVLNKSELGTRYLLLFYVFPMVCEKRSDFALILHDRLRGVYIGDTNKPQWEDKIVVLFKTCAPKQFKDFYRSNPYSYKNYYEDIDGDLYEILSFHVPQKYEDDLQKILNNKFTKVSNILRDHIDWVAFPEDSFDYWSWLDGLHEKLEKINKDLVPLDLNGVNKK